MRALASRKLIRIGAHFLLLVLFGSSLFALSIQAQEFEDTDQINGVVTKTANLIKSNYFDEKVANQVSQELLKRGEKNGFGRFTKKVELARTLSKYLLHLTADKHLAVFWSSPEKANPEFGARSKERREQIRKNANSGIRRIEILKGNIAYLELTAFFRKNEVEQKYKNAIGLISDADAIIIDLRENGGGSPEGVVELAGYFFRQNSVKLFDIVSRDGKQTVYKTNRAKNRVWLDQPLLVLTGPRTFSAGEGFAFIMQDQKRAKVIGSVTAGAANPGKSYRIDDEFSIVIPNGKVVAANSKKNWEGKGVQPDIPIKTTDVIELAQGIARDAIAKKAQEDFRRKFRREPNRDKNR